MSDYKAETQELRDKIDNLELNVKWNGSQYIFSNKDLDAIAALIHSETTKARIDELNNLKDKQDICYDCTHDIYGDATEHMPYVPLSAIDDRIAVLQITKVQQ